MSAIQNIITGTKELAEERETKLADVQAQMKLEAGEVPAEVAEGTDAQEAPEAMTTEQMQEAITVLSSAVMTLTNRLDGGQL